MNKSEYMTEPCPNCKKQNMRHKLKRDWTKGEHTTKGYHPTLGNYLICDNCNKSYIQQREKRKINIMKNMQLYAVITI